MFASVCSGKDRGPGPVPTLTWIISPYVLYGVNYIDLVSLDVFLCGHSGKNRGPGPVSQSGENRGFPYRAADPVCYRSHYAEALALTRPGVPADGVSRRGHAAAPTVERLRLLRKEHRSSACFVSPFLLCSINGLLYGAGAPFACCVLFLFLRSTEKNETLYT